MVALDLRSLVRQEKARRQATQLCDASSNCRDDGPGVEAVDQPHLDLSQHSIGIDAVQARSDLA